MKKKILGISLLEILLSLSIITIILVSALRYYTVASFEQKLNDATDMIQGLRSAAPRWLLSHDDYKDISVANLKYLNLLPERFGTHPWHGVIGITGSNQNPGMYVINLDKIPFNACNDLKNRFATDSQSAVCTQITDLKTMWILTLTFQE